MLELAKRYDAPVDILEITPEAVVERLSYRLRLVVGPGRPWCYQELAARTGIDVRTLKAYVQGTACPNLVKYKRLLAVLGPEIGAELNVMKGWLPRSDAIPPEAIDLAHLRDELAQVVAIIRDVLDDEIAGHPDEFVESHVEFDQGHEDEPVERAVYTDVKPSVLNARDIDIRAVVDRLSHRLRSMIGPDRPWSLDDVAERTAIDRRTLQSYLDGAACPNLARFLRLSHLLGPEIGVELAQMIGWVPRYGSPQHVDRGDIESLLQKLSAARDSVDRVLKCTRAPGSSVRFLRRGDCLTVRETDGAQSEMVIPLKPQM